MKYINQYINFNLKEHISNLPEKYWDDRTKKIYEILVQLSDCLQEVFDKYQIPQEKPNTSIDELKWYINIQKGKNQYIIITEINPKLQKEIYLDICKIKDKTEKRINHEIFIEKISYDTIIIYLEP